jgi:peptidoglycan-N-acetylglucosamine deacetylase
VRWPHALTGAYAIWCLTGVCFAGPSWWLVTLIGGLFLAVSMFLAVAVPGLRAFAPVVTRGSRHGQTIAFTFDDGPDPRSTPAVLDILRRHQVAATFFMIGEKVDRYPELVRQVMAAGHTVACHGYRHDWRQALIPRLAHQNLVRGMEALRRASDRQPRFFRPPYGVMTPAMGLAIARTAMTPVGWSIRTWDTMPWARSPQHLQRLIRSLSPGAIVLLHDASEQPGAAIPGGLSQIEPLLFAAATAGLHAVSLDELLENGVK